MSTEQSTTTEVAQLARRLMNENGLGDWSFQFDRAVRRYGCCHWKTTTISLSEKLAVLNPLEKNREIVLHEIAHALAVPQGDKGHGRIWKAEARKLGIAGDRCYSHEDTVTPAAPFVHICDNCGGRYPRHRQSRSTGRKVACKSCCRKFNSGRFTDRFLLRLERNR